MAPWCPVEKIKKKKNNNLWLKALSHCLGIHDNSGHSHKLVLQSVAYPKIVKKTPILIEESIACNVYT